VFEQFAPYVLRVLPRMGIARHDVADVAQEVFIAVFRGLPGFERRSSIKTWVYGVCIRVANNHKKRAYHRRERLADSVPERSDGRTPANDLEESRELGALDRALAELPEVQRVAFVLCYVETLTVAEIAEATGASKFTVYSRLYAARRRVLSALGKQHGELEP
jgi:RNA polymerase sigma-70 factor, ECF subfamily